MQRSLRHRGPDDSGVWVDETAGNALGHRRLSILDLSIAGHQPMASAGGRYVIAFNGEIYNHLELRGELGDMSSVQPVPNTEKCKTAWRGHADTETLLECFASWGIEKTLERAVGMFAIALWDCETRTLTLARDRMGQKPRRRSWQQTRQCRKRHT